MKLSRKAILSIVFIVVLTTSGLIAWTQFFGKVVSGMDVVDKIAKVETGTKDVYLPDYNMTYPFEDWPVQDIIITRAYMKP
jgi:cyclophilin family peptidyl-prolyl cis-trans isomerase